MKQTVLIIGGNGFIGSHLIDGLLENNYRVRVFDISFEKFRNPNPKVNYHISNQNSLHSLYEAMIGVEIIFHLASTTVPSTSNIDLIGDINNNLISTLDILNLSIQQGIKTFVYFSSGGAIYGNPEFIPVSENHPKNPISSYGIVKATIESYILLYNTLYNLNYLIIRPSNSYGPRQGHISAQGVISTFLRNAHNDEPFQIYGNGTTKKDYIYVKDIIAITIKLVELDSQGIYNIGSGIGTSLNEIIEVINKTINKKNEVIYTEQKNYDVSHFILDVNKCLSQIGDNYEFTPLENGINLTHEWMLQNGI